MKNDAGKVVLRYKTVTSVEVDNKKLLLVCEGDSNGVLSGYTFIDMKLDSAINKVRSGRLVAWMRVGGIGTG